MAAGWKTDSRRWMLVAVLGAACSDGGCTRTKLPRHLPDTAGEQRSEGVDGPIGDLSAEAAERVLGAWSPLPQGLRVTSMTTAGDQVFVGGENQGQRQVWRSSVPTMAWRRVVIPLLESRYPDDVDEGVDVRARLIDGDMHLLVNLLESQGGSFGLLHTRDVGATAWELIPVPSGNSDTVFGYTSAFSGSEVYALDSPGFDRSTIWRFDRMERETRSEDRFIPPSRWRGTHLADEEATWWDGDLSTDGRWLAVTLFDEGGTGRIGVWKRAHPGAAFERLPDLSLPWLPGSLHFDGSAMVVSVSVQEERGVVVRRIEAAAPDRFIEVHVPDPGHGFLGGVVDVVDGRALVLSGPPRVVRLADLGITQTLDHSGKAMGGLTRSHAVIVGDGQIGVFALR